MINDETIARLYNLAATLDSDEILSRLRAAGWHTKTFGGMGVVAAHPTDENFSLGAAGFWLQIGNRPLVSGQFLWVFPTAEAAEIFQ